MFSTFKYFTIKFNLHFLFFIFLFFSCQSLKEDPTPATNKHSALREKVQSLNVTPIGCMSPYERDQAVYDKMYGQYGYQGEAIWTDIQNQIATSTPLPVRFSNHVIAIENAIATASSDYVNQLTPDSEGNVTFVPDDLLLNHLIFRFNIVKYNIYNDPLLNTTDKTILNGTIDHIIDKFVETQTELVAGIDCFPNPPGYDAVAAAKLFKGILKAVKKAVQIVVNVVLTTVEFAIRGGLIGWGIGNTPEAIFLGTGVGFLYGFGKGIVDSINGNYRFCLFNCS